MPGSTIARKVTGAPQGAFVESASIGSMIVVRVRTPDGDRLYIEHAAKWARFDRHDADRARDLFEHGFGQLEIARMLGQDPVATQNAIAGRGKWRELAPLAAPYQRRASC